MNSFQKKIIDYGRPLNKEGTWLLITPNRAVVGTYKRKLTAVSDQRRLQAYKGELKIVSKEEYVQIKGK